MDQNDNRLQCKRCGIDLPESQLRNLANPEYNEWYRECYCSYACFKDIKCKSSQFPTIITHATQTSDISNIYNAKASAITNFGNKTTGSTRSNPPLPILAKIAGIIWGVEGCLFILSGIFSIFKPTTLAVGIVLITLGGVLAHNSERTLRGKAKSTFGNGIGSLIFGVISIYQLIPNRMADPVATCSAAFFSLALLTAGLFALLVREKYEDYLERCHAVRLGFVNDDPYPTGGTIKEM